MDLKNWQDLHDRLDQAHRNSIGSRIGAREFFTMHRNVYQKLQEADAEWVNCRRRGQGSPKFNRLLEQAEESLKTFESYILLAKLMYKEHQ